MKKVVALALALVMALSFAACSPYANMANPFVTYDTIQEAFAGVGFAMEVPELVEGYTSSRTILGTSGSNLSMIEVQYHSADGKTRRSNTNDISGDYNNYSVSKTVTVGTRSVMLKGNSDGLFKVAIWTIDGYAYAVVSNSGLSERALTAIIQQVA